MSSKEATCGEEVESDKILRISTASKITGWLGALFYFYEPFISQEMSGNLEPLLINCNPAVNRQAGFAGTNIIHITSTTTEGEDI